MIAKKGLDSPTNNSVTVLRYHSCLDSKNNNFTFKVEVIRSLKSTCPDGLVAKIGLNGL